MNTAGDIVASRRDGIALLAVLSAIVAIAAIGAASRTQITLDNLRLDRNRRRVQALWVAEGCFNTALADLELTLRSLPLADPRRAAIDSITLPSVATKAMGCAVSMRPLGTGMPAADRSVDVRLTSYLRASLGASAQADSLAEALLDWEDADTLARRLGAELDWYRSRGRLAPKNAPIASDGELALVRGYESEGLRQQLAGLISVDDGVAVCARRTSLPVLAARLETTAAIAMQIRRSDDAGLAFERRSGRSLRIATAQPGIPTFSCDRWRLQAKAATGMDRDSLTYAAVVVVLANRVAILGVETER